MHFIKSLGGAALGLALALCAAGAPGKDVHLVRRMHRFEDELADTISFLLYKAPISPEAIIFVNQTTRGGEAGLPKLLKGVHMENYKDLVKRFREKKNRTKAGLLGRLEQLKEMQQESALHTRDRIFSRDTSQQAMGIHRRILTQYIDRVGRMQETQVGLFWRSLDKLKSMKGDDRNRLLEKYQEYMVWALRSLKEGVSFRRRMEGGAREFNNLIKRALMESGGPSLEKFKMERARFNLGGSILSPALFLQMAEESGRESEKIVRELSRALFVPQKILAARLKGRESLDMKEGVLDFIKASVGIKQAHYLREAIDGAHHMRSELICKFARGRSDREQVMRHIDHLQREDNTRMLETFEQADPAFFRDFLLYSGKMVKDYEKLLTLENTSEILKRELEREAGLPDPE
jgi:hypothetical protein